MVIPSDQHYVEEAPSGAPPGLKVAANTMTPEYEKEIIGFIDSLELAYFQQPDSGDRFNRAFGWGYDPKTYELIPTDPIPSELEPLRRMAAEFAAVQPYEMAHCMVSRFETGAMIPWLKMRPIWRHLVGISLGSPMPMKFRKDGEGEREISLAPRSMYLLAGESRYEYEHSFPPTAEFRWCIWFRDLSDEGRRTVEKFGFTS